MDPFKFTTIAHRHMSVCNPIESSALDACLDILGVGSEGTVIDVGCGKGEILIRLAERHGTRGVGLDINPEFLRIAEAEARRRAPGRITFHLVEAMQFPVEPGSFAAAICLGSTHAYGDFKAAIRALIPLVRPGGCILLGEGYWRQEPGPGYLHLLGAMRDELDDHAANLAAGVEAGLSPLFDRTSTLAEWDAYEDLYARTVEEYLEAHPDDPDADALRHRVRTWRQGYLRWGRDTLGFGTYVFQKP
jgi:SAM-dependent methyltransferase